MMSKPPMARGWLYRLTVPVEGYDPRRVDILFEGPVGRVPTVWADGPGSPHRYGDDSLCIWYPKDPPERRWVFDDGLLALISQVTVHLFKEAWWRETGGDVRTGATGEWLGDEAPHGPPGPSKGDETRRAA
jgi:hypothetical protein